MKVPHDLVVEIISHLPLKFAVQCKLLSKNFNTRISEPKFSQTLSQRHQKISTLINSSCGISKILHKISINSTPASHWQTTLPVKVNVLATSKGLILIDFHEFKNFCVFNPITGARQLIRYPDPKGYYHSMSDPGLAVDYPTSDQYMLVTASWSLDEEGRYKFKVFSSEGSGVWREFELKMNVGNTTPLYLDYSRPVYVHDSFHWLRGVGGVLAFHTKKEEAIITDLPELIHRNYPICWKWLGVAHGLLTLVCTFENSIVIAAYDYASNEWNVSHNMTSFIMGIDYYNYSFPVWIDSEHVFFLVECPPAHDHDSEIKRYKITPYTRYPHSEKDYGVFDCDFYTFVPTLASVHTMLSHPVHRKHLSYITATLDELKRFITDSSS